MLEISQKMRHQLARWTQMSDLQKCFMKKKLKHQKTLLSVSNNSIFWNISAFLLLLATRSSNRFSE